MPPEAPKPVSPDDLNVLLVYLVDEIVVVLTNPLSSTRLLHWSRNNPGLVYRTEPAGARNGIAHYFFRLM